MLKDRIGDRIRDMIGGRIVDVTGERTGCDRNMTCNMIKERTEAGQYRYGRQRGGTGQETGQKIGQGTGQET